MNNHYEVPEVIEIGRAQDVILGGAKFLQIFNDAPSQARRDAAIQDDE